jgi:hypothetical protein
MEEARLLTLEALSIQMNSNYVHYLFLSFFPIEVAITVVNPSLWLGIYKEHHSSALFFVTFQFVSNIYFHSLVLSVVFRAYLRALKHVRME